MRDERCQVRWGVEWSVEWSRGKRVQFELVSLADAEKIKTTHKQAGPNQLLTHTHTANSRQAIETLQGTIGGLV